MIKLDWNEYLEKAVQVNAEGAVLVRNQGGLPLDKNKEFAVFGRIQLDYYKSGTGSGGMVNVAKVTGITEGLLDAGAKLNEEVLKTYRDWFAENPHIRPNFSILVGFRSVCNIKTRLEQDKGHVLIPR